MEQEPTSRRVPIRELVRYYPRLGLRGFGGPSRSSARWNARWSASGSG
jgi:hypothetical protein